MQKTILSLCDYSGEWSAPYLRSGYRVVCVDIAHPEGIGRGWGGYSQVGADLREWTPDFEAHGILAAPPCTCFCRPGARWWKQMDASGQTADDIALMRACLRICKTATGWWALENPPGRHVRLIPELGAPSWQWTPNHYGDPWHKQTYIWGTARKPEPTNIVVVPPTIRTPNGHTQGRIARMSSSWKREREKTPAGFAQAFFAANP